MHSKLHSALNLVSVFPFPIVSLGVVLLCLIPSPAPGQSVSFAGAQTTLATDGLDQPFGIAVDSSGDIFIADSGNDRVVEVPQSATGYGHQTVLPITGVSQVNGVAVDGAGDVFLPDPPDDQVVELLQSATFFKQGPSLPIRGLSNPNGIAIDGAGDIFVTEPFRNAVAESVRTQTGYDPWTTLASNGLLGNWGIAVDSAGDIFLADTGNSRIVELPWTGMGYGTQITLPFTGLSYPYGVAVNAAGDVLAADTYNARVVELPKIPTGYGPQITLPFSGPFVPIGIALDNAGGVFVTDYATNQALELQTRSVKFPSPLPVGNVPGISLTFHYNVQASVTFGTPKVLTGGQPSNDFAVAEGGTCAGPVAAGAQCTVTVNFSPSAEGVRTASVEITDGSGNVLATTPVSGIGVGAANTPPVVQVSANVLQFGTIPFGSSKDLALTVSNIGGETLTVFPSINAQSFTIVDSTCGIGLAPGQSCTLAVQFSAVTISTHFATLTLVTNTSLSPTVALQGVATGISVSSPTLQFGTIPFRSSAVLPLTLTNHGVPGTVTINFDVTPAGYSFYEASGSTCNAGIVSGQSCVVLVEFDPRAIGQHDGVLTLIPSGGAAARTIGLHGIASGLVTNPGSPNFGPVPDGSSVVKTITITDVDLPGTVNVTATITLASSFYTILDTDQNTCGQPLTAGQSCVLPLQFAPSNKVGSIVGILSLTSSAGGHPRSILLYGDGSRN